MASFDWNTLPFCTNPAVHDRRVAWRGNRIWGKDWGLFDWVAGIGCSFWVCQRTPPRLSSPGVGPVGSGPPFHHQPKQEVSSWSSQTLKRKIVIIKSTKIYQNGCKAPGSNFCILSFWTVPGPWWVLLKTTYCFQQVSNVFVLQGPCIFPTPGGLLQSALKIWAPRIASFSLGSPMTAGAQAVIKKTANLPTARNLQDSVTGLQTIQKLKKGQMKTSL